MYSNDGGGVVGGFLVYVEDGGCVIKIMELDILERTNILHWMAVWPTSTDVFGIRRW